jgi:serine/threonine-protein kinase HipA
MLYDGKSRRLAPGYDLVSTVFWPSLATAPAMKIGGSDSINSILSGHWRKFAEEIRISPTALRTRIKQLCTTILTHTCKTLSLPDECNAVLEIIKDRAKKLSEV